jgi:hypothetical protein
MNTDGFALLQRTITALEGTAVLPNPLDDGFVGVKGVSELKRALTGQPAETPAEIAKLKDALKHLPSSVRRGQGSFFTMDGAPEPNYWLAGVWAIASLQWACGIDIARQWSKQCPELYTADGFEKAWTAYEPTHANPIGIGSLYKRAIQMGWQSANQLQVGIEAEIEPANEQRYKLLQAADIQQLPPMEWRVKGVFPARGFGAVYGPSGSGKSFLVLDMAAAIARGRPWFGRKTKAATVVYVALEGEAGLKNRLAAWEKKKGYPAPAELLVVIQPFKLSEPRDIKDLASVIPEGSVTIIDTLNRAAPTADENSSKDMGEILEASKWLFARTNGLVILVHHTGKEVGKGARGHSSFFAALDGAIEVTRTTLGRAWNVAKSKDGEDGDNTPFRLEIHDLGVDADGDIVTSCTVEPEHGQLFKKPEPKGAQQKVAYLAIKGALQQSTVAGKAGCGASSCLSVTAAVAAVASKLTAAKSHQRKNRAGALLDSLTAGDTLTMALRVTRCGYGCRYEKSRMLVSKYPPYIGGMDILDIWAAIQKSKE